MLVGNDFDRSRKEHRFFASDSPSTETLFFSWQSGTLDHLEKRLGIAEGEKLTDNRKSK